MACHHFLSRLSLLSNNLFFCKNYIFGKYNKIPSLKILAIHIITLLALVHFVLFSLSLKKTYYFLLILRKKINKYLYFSSIFFLKKNLKIFLFSKNITIVLSLNSTNHYQSFKQIIVANL